MGGKIPYSRIGLLPVRMDEGGREFSSAFKKSYGFGETLVFKKKKKKGPGKKRVRAAWAGRRDLTRLVKRDKTRMNFLCGGAGV